MSELDDLLDSTLDDIEDLPEFKPFPAGAHHVKATFTMDEINKKPVIKLDLVLVETVEQADPSAEASKEGDSSGTMFMLDNKYGIGNFKKCAAPFAEALDLTTNREIIEGVKDVECVVITSIRTDKNDPDKEYLNIKEIKIL